jgi:hypothetical protein
MIMAERKGFSLFDLFNMSRPGDETSSQGTKEAPQWTEKALKDTPDSAFDRFAVGDNPDDFDLFDLANELDFVKEMKGSNGTINGE